MTTVSIIGSGNVAFHLISAFKKAANVELIQVCARNSKNIEKLVDPSQIVSFPKALNPVDIVILAISDDAIASVSESVPEHCGIVAHTSGSMPITELSAKHRRAVFYPLQTFSAAKALDFASIPICLESEFPEDYSKITELARTISNANYSINSFQRKALHVAAVFVNNFVNEMYQIGYEICGENQIPFAILQPLILETAEKLKTLTPPEAQTGPAKRRDQKTITTHLEFLQNENKKRLYEIMTKSIQSHAEKL